MYASTKPPIVNEFNKKKKSYIQKLCNKLTLKLDSIDIATSNKLALKNFE